MSTIEEPADRTGTASWWAGCLHCGGYFLTTFPRRIPRHTRSVRGVGWGGKAMHLPCPGGER